MLSTTLWARWYCSPFLWESGKVSNSSSSCTLWTGELGSSICNAMLRFLYFLQITDRMERKEDSSLFTVPSWAFLHPFSYAPQTGHSCTAHAYYTLAFYLVAIYFLKKCTSLYSYLLSWVCTDLHPFQRVFTN